MLILSKILPLFVLPPGLCILIALAALLWRRWWLIWISMLILWVFSMPVVGVLLAELGERPYHRVAIERVGKADAVVVLSGMIVRIEGAPLGEWGEAADRFEGGVELYKAGKAPRLVFTGGYIPWLPDFVPEGEILAERARRMGVPDSAILLTGKVANTADEAVATANLLDVNAGRSRRIILVTSASHMQRASRLFRDAGFQVVPYPVDFHDKSLMNGITVKDFLPSATALDLSSAALREMLGRVVALLGVSLLVSGK